MSENEHSRSCMQLTLGSDDECTCGLVYRQKIATLTDELARVKVDRDRYWRDYQIEGQARGRLESELASVRAEAEATREAWSNSNTRLVKEPCTKTRITR